MSFEAMTWAVDIKLPAVQKLILLLLANRTHKETGICFPSHATLAIESGLSKRALINNIQKLEQQGLLTVVRTSKDGVKQVNNYRLNLGTGSSCDSEIKAQRNRAINTKRSELNALKGNELYALRSALDTVRSELDSIRVENEVHLGVANEVHINQEYNLTSKRTRKDNQGNYNELPPISHERIVEIYHEEVPGLSRVIDITPERKNMLKKLAPKIQTEFAWREFFEIVRNSDFLNGKNDRNWKANFSWLINYKNAVKVIEGNYNNAPAKKPIDWNDTSWADGLAEQCDNGYYGI
jgi:hypothetical protein